MSIPIGSADTIVTASALAIAVLASLLIAVACGVFSRASLFGPNRLGEDESVSDVAIATFMGVIAWILAQSIYVSFRQVWYHRVAHVAEAPTKLSEPEVVVLNLGLYLVVFLTLMLISKFWRPTGLNRLGASARAIPMGIWMGVIGVIIMFPIVLVTNISSEIMWNHFQIPHPPEHELLTILKDTPRRWLQLAVVVAASVAAPLAEETFFRGHVQTIIRYTAKSPWVAILLTSALFAAIHPWWTIPPIFVLALGLGYLYERTGNLWACITMHSLFNLGSMGLFYFTEMSRPV